MDMTLKNKRIVILGGTSGIGLATAQAAAQDGATIVGYLAKIKGTS
jgi:NAD(P)-dependent dehydrogenase (short-subunit alcohol dehydrogenase family)